MNIEKLKQNLDYFSVQLKELKNLDEVKVAGKIKNIIKLDEYYYINLDDYLGDFNILISEDAYNYYNLFLKEGNYISVEGILSLFDVYSNEETKKNLIVCAYQISLLAD